jgi:hypothetical protein
VGRRAGEGGAAAAPQPAHVAVAGRRNRPKSGPSPAARKWPAGYLPTASTQDTVYRIRWRDLRNGNGWPTRLRARLNTTGPAPPNMEVTISDDADR